MIPKSEYYEMHVKAKHGDTRIEHVFDVRIDTDELAAMFIVAPRVAGGCMMIELPKQGTQCNIFSILADSRCSKSNTLQRKYGTRMMLLGSIHCVVKLASKKFPNINELVLSDEASYPCPPLVKTIKTFVTDLLIKDDMYYARHLNMKPVNPLIQQRIEIIKRRVNGPIDDSFEGFWMRVYGPGVETDHMRNTQTKEQRAWLKSQKHIVKQACDACKTQNKTWREFFETLYATYGCTFFASCALRLVDFFNMNRLLGASWSVMLKDIPQIAEGVNIKSKLTKAQTGGYVSNEIQGRLSKLQSQAMQNILQRHNLV